MRPLIAGNWKMNGLAADLAEIAALSAWARREPFAGDLLICLPATLLSRAVAAAGQIAIGGQDCHPQAGGAFTGDVAAEMLADAGASAVIVGHSERRLAHAEGDDLIAAKARAAHRAGLLAIICVGESLAERKAGDALGVVAAQVAASVPSGSTAARTAIAYEPVWAIGTGLTPTIEQIEEAHVALREALVLALGEAGAGAPILYGGSVKPANAAEILKVREVGGALVGGASLKAEDFLAIVRAAD